MRQIISILALVALAGCSSSPTKISDMQGNVGEERVLNRIDDVSSRPDWLRESEPFRITAGKVYSLGMTSLPADDRVEAGFRIAENNGKAAISNAIEQRLDFVFQNAEEGTSLSGTQARYIGAEASKLTTNSLRPSKRYWEKVATTQENGQVSVQYRVFALVEMPENDFKTAIFDAIRRSKGQDRISADFAKKVDQHWDQFVNGSK
jgi:hypothetical protein